MGVARQLRSRKTMAKETSRATYEKYVFKSGRHMGRYFGAYISFRSPLKFYYGKKPRRAHARAVMEGVRNYYSYYGKRYLPGSRPHPLSSFSLWAARAESRKEGKKQRTVEHELAGVKNKEKTRKTDKASAGTEVIKAPKSSVKSREKPLDVRVEARYVPLKKAKTDKADRKEKKVKPEQPRLYVVKAVETRIEKQQKRAVVKVLKAPTVEKMPGINVSKDVKIKEKTSTVFKTVATTEKPRTSVKKWETRLSPRVLEKEGGRHLIASNQNSKTKLNDFALPVRPFSFFSVSAKAAKMEPEKIVKLIEEKVEAPETKKVTVKTEDDPYHKVNRRRARLLFPKIAAGAADSIS